LYGSDLDVHDLLLIDDRGRGLSTTVDCEDLQHGTSTFSKAESNCAAQLGASASWYGTGDIAQDVEAVRVALGYDKVDYHGGSYGGEDVTAYATRFGEHLRSIVLDAPAGTAALHAFELERSGARSIPREVRLDCQRSPTCRPDHVNPEAELEALILSTRHHALNGSAFDANGNLVQVRIDEKAVLILSGNGPTGVFINNGEILAAARSWSQGDARPLLRLGAEAHLSPLTDAGDPTINSIGAKYATACVDVHQPWDWSAPVSKTSVTVRGCCFGTPNKLLHSVFQRSLHQFAFQPFATMSVVAKTYSVGSSGPR